MLEFEAITITPRSHPREMRDAAEFDAEVDLEIRNCV
jgi:hypothetical protein